MRHALTAFAAMLCAATASANAPPPPNAEEKAPAWTLGEGPILTLSWGTEDGIAIVCPEAAKTLIVSATPAWETDYTMDNGKVFEGPLDEVIVSFGKETFPATLVPKPADMKDEDYFVSYSLPANADTVTAIMLADNITVTLKADPQQSREGTPDASGAFDSFATTCAQINGLK